MKRKMLFLFVLIALTLTACGAKAEAPAQAAPASEPITLGSEPVEAAPAQAQVELPAAETQPIEEEEPASPASGGTYTAPEGLFTLEIPDGWAKEKDTNTIENGSVETFASPDGNAFVQVVVNEAGKVVSALEKGQITLDFMRRLNGKDLRVARDVLLKDGREQLDWWSDQQGTSGTVYFDKQGNYLFYVNLFYKDAQESTYKPILKEVAESFVSQAN